MSHAKESFLAWYGSTAQRAELAGHESFHVRTRALASLRQMGHDDMNHEQYSKLHSDHLTKSMSTENLSNMYAALVDPRIKPEHLQIAVNREFTTSRGQIFQREAQKKLDKLNQNHGD